MKTLMAFVKTKQIGYQKQLAKDIGVSESTISNIIHGRCLPSVKVLLKICQVTKLEPLDVCEAYYIRKIK